ncbi:MAG: hypothetical protein L7F78_06555, partial [Syntrophales bacterium LBB04]|nr:hypothetical protein [Syntrophales bacterium LBB04]
NHRQVKQFCGLTEEGKKLLKAAIDELGLSARAYDKVLKAVRTISDPAGSENILPEHFAEAIQYRSLDRQWWTRGAVPPVLSIPSFNIRNTCASNHNSIPGLNIRYLTCRVKTAKVKYFCFSHRREDSQLYLLSHQTNTIRIRCGNRRAKNNN